MTEDQLTELLTHPRVHEFIKRIAEDAAVGMVTRMPIYKERVVRPRIAAQGDLNYPDAAAYIGCPKDSIRTYVHKGDLHKGKLPSTVTFTSCSRFKRTYQPAHLKKKNP
jgi:hypothetical protein